MFILTCPCPSSESYPFSCLPGVPHPSVLSLPTSVSVSSFFLAIVRPQGKGVYEECALGLELFQLLGLTLLSLSLIYGHTMHIYTYRIAGNFRGANYSWLNTGPRIEATLPTFTFSASSNHENRNHKLTR